MEKNNGNYLLSDIMNIAEKNSLRFERFPNAYDFDVETCIDASKARGVPLEREIKHVVFEFREGLFMVHVQGDKFISNRKVKNFLSIKNLKKANLTKHFNNKFRKGTVCPFIEPFFSMNHLVDESLLNFDWLSTNDGTLRGYIIFETSLLTHLNRIHFGNFSKD